jgi:hypothetical protein
VAQTRRTRFPVIVVDPQNPAETYSILSCGCNCTWMINANRYATCEKLARLTAKAQFCRYSTAARRMKALTAWSVD